MAARSVVLDRSGGENEVAEACVHAALLWVRWVLARHTTVFLGNLTQLLADLEASTFSSGALAERLDAANIPGLSEPEQRRLGVAVGRRTANETWTVRIDGVQACSMNPERWPDAYRTCVVEGLFINSDSQVDALPAVSADCAVEILQHHGDAAGVLTELDRRLGAASWSFRFQGRHEDVVESIHRVLPRVPSDMRPLWSGIADTLAAHTPEAAS